MNIYQEALDNITCLDTNDEDTTMYDLVGEEIDILQELIDKETPKKVKVWDNAEPATRCPVCGRGVYKYGDDEYCPNCGQKLDWSEE